MPKKFFDYIFIAIIGYLVVTKAPHWFSNINLQSKPAPQALVKRVSGEQIEFPVLGQKMIVVFWATWCGPCKVELNRMNKLMSKGVIKNNELLAISIQENQKTVVDFLNQNNYQFLVALDESGLVAEKYHVSGTPTVVFISDAGQIDWITTGLSPSLEFRIKKFLSH